jgi:hypothetical protein
MDLLEEERERGDVLARDLQRIQVSEGVAVKSELSTKSLYPFSKDSRHSA